MNSMDDKQLATSVAAPVAPWHAFSRQLSWRVGAAIVATIACAVLPLVLQPYGVRILTNIFMYGVLAQALNVIVGFAGYHAFGNVAWFGVGAYAGALAVNAGVPLPLAILLATLVAAALAFILGWPLLRLSGHYFAIASVVLNLALNEIVLNLGDLTGGAAGVNLPMSTLPVGEFYVSICYLMFGAMVLAILIVGWLTRSRLGYALRALKDSERAAQVMGVNTTLAKMTAWAISGGLTGLAGAIWAYWMNFIEPGTAFDIGISVKAYIMMLMGGMGSLFGPVVGAFFLEFISDLIWEHFLKLHLLVLGALIIAIVTLMPEGAFGSIKRVIVQRRKAGR